MNGEFLKRIRRGVISGNRDFRLRPISYGFGVAEHGTLAEIADLAANGISAKLYNYIDKRPGRGDGDRFIYLLSRRE